MLVVVIGFVASFDATILGIGITGGGRKFLLGTLIGNLVLTCGKTNELWIFEFGFRLSAAEFMSVLPEVAILKENKE